MYLSNLHIECYKFCQYCKNYFDIAKATEPNQISFAIFFSINQSAVGRSNIKPNSVKQKSHGSTSNNFFKKILITQRLL